MEIEEIVESYSDYVNNKEAEEEQAQEVAEHICTFVDADRDMEDKYALMRELEYAHDPEVGVLLSRVRNVVEVLMGDERFQSFQKASIEHWNNKHRKLRKEAQ